ncbi:MAG: 3-oxoadipate enol-lactonase [Acinetobacter populi]|uniref:3-oxoadipate enol-lactonase n=1 Tax=Acinetobacter populi TaxID=1582270 RepID=UPI002355F027|nr:3-oxoadipate enol-lactonase [Acinetobacter populi]MCH4246470.1 3-oxoadipate enol-lactonase [Acinetobacter populi]
MPIAQLKDVSLNYETFGDHAKPALIFSNSLGTNYRMWQAQYEVLQQYYFIICYDTRGHGASSTPKPPYALADLGQDVIDLLDYLKIEKAFFCGISMGGLTGQWLAIYYPEYFYRIMICNTAAKIGQEKAWQDRAALVREQGLRPIASTAASRWFTESFIQSNAGIVQHLANDLEAGSTEGYANCCEALAQADVRAKLKDIRIPVIIVAGTEDPITTITDGEYMQQHITDAKLVTIAASHISNIEQPEQFNQFIQNIVKFNEAG